MQNLHAHLQGKKHVIWDWNGTLLDDVDLCVSIIGEILANHDLPAIDRQAYLGAFRFPVREYYKTLGFDFARVSFESLSAMFIERYNHRVFECSLFDGCHELFSDLAAGGVKVSVLSAAQEDHLREQLEHHEILHHFTHVYGIRDFYAHGKIDRGLELIAVLDGMGVVRDEIIMVGDTDHDVEVAKTLGIDALLLHGGHQCPTRLALVHDRVVAR